MSAFYRRRFTGALKTKQCGQRHRIAALWCSVEGRVSYPATPDGIACGIWIARPNRSIALLSSSRSVAAYGWRRVRRWSLAARRKRISKLRKARSAWAVSIRRSRGVSTTSGDAVCSFFETGAKRRGASPHGFGYRRTEKFPRLGDNTDLRRG